jgi:hypothetical protein
MGPYGDLEVGFDRPTMDVEALTLSRVKVGAKG